MNREEIKIDGIPLEDYGTPKSRTCYSNNYTNKEKLNKQKVIDNFKKYVEAWYLDLINKETIEIYAIETGLTEEEKEVLERRFL